MNNRLLSRRTVLKGMGVALGLPLLDQLLLSPLLQTRFRQRRHIAVHDSAGNALLQRTARRTLPRLPDQAACGLVRFPVQKNAVRAHPLQL